MIMSLRTAVDILRETKTGNLSLLALDVIGTVLTPSFQATFPLTLAYAVWELAQDLE